MTYMSTAERLVKLHDKMCDNIEAMGGTVDPTGTLIEIADAILDIPPVPVGVSIDTATTCSADKSTTTVSSPVTFTGKVSAYHDDETSANVDLIGYLKGATVKFYNGQTLLGSTTTDNNGEYSFSYTPLVAGEMSVIAMFEAIEDYKQSSSTAVVITVSSYSDIVMSADKPILSYADGDKATLYAQLVDENDAPLAIEGVTLTFKKDSTVLGTADTDSTGLATLVDGYTSQGVGDVTLSVTDGTFLTKTFIIQDTQLYDASSSSNVSKYTVPSGLSFSYDSTLSAYKITVVTTSEDFRTLYHTDGIFPTDCTIEYDLYVSNIKTSNVQCLGGLMNTNDNMRVFFRYVKASNTFSIAKSSTYSNRGDLVALNVNLSYNTWYHISITYNGTDVTATIKQGATTLSTLTTTTSLLNSTSNRLVFGMYSGYNGNGSVSYIKNIKVKPIQSINIDVDNPILSFADSTQANPQIATLTATVYPIEQGKTVKIYQDDTLVATETTDSQGQVSYEYTSQGIGDVEFEFKCGLLTKTFAIEDCFRYIQTPSDYQTFSVPTGNYKILWNGKFTSSSDFTSAINDGTSNYVGVASSHGDIGFYNPNNFLTSQLVADNVEHLFELDYNNGTWTFKHNNESVSDNRTLNTSALKVRRANNNSMHDFKIKPL